MTRSLILGLNAGSRQGKCFLHESKYVLWTLEGRILPVTHCWGQRTLVLSQPSLKFSYNLDEVARLKWQNPTKNLHLTLFTVAFFPHSLAIAFFFLFAKHRLDYSLLAIIQTYCLASASIPTSMSLGGQASRDVWVLLKRSKFHLSEWWKSLWEAQTAVCMLRLGQSKCFSVCINRCMLWNIKVSQLMAFFRAYY